VERPGSKAATSPHNPDSGLSHFGIGQIRRTGVQAVGSWIEKEGNR
jgi:hypothetical protein